MDKRAFVHEGALVQPRLALHPYVRHVLAPRGIDEVRDRVFTLTGPAYRLMWLLTHARFERQNWRAMRHV